LFSLTNGEKLTLTSPDMAIYNHPSYGPAFGSGYDLYIANQSNNNGSCYANIGSSYKNPNYNYNNQQSWTRFQGSTSNSNFRTVEY
jgi:hypothetical protein